MASQGHQIDELMEQATAALQRTDYFEAERLCQKALIQARRLRDYERLARICMPLQEARRQRLSQALDARGPVAIINTPYDENFVPGPGCLIVDPMLVAADARRLRLRALERRVPLAILCREPLTRSGLQPIVALGEVVVRAKVRPAKKHDRPSKEWFIEALEALGDAAIDEVDPALEGERLVDAYLDRLDAVPDHEKLHQRLADAARAAAHLLAAA
jgi:hypothetical protein